MRWRVQSVKDEIETKGITGERKEMKKSTKTAAKPKSNKKVPAAGKTAAGKKKSNSQKNEKRKQPPKRKNVSQTIPNGTILQTRDEYLHNQGSYRKEGYEGKGNYRKVAVVDSNRKNELGIVKLYSKSGVQLQGTPSRYKPFVETLDDKDENIKVGKKFIPSGQMLSKKNVTAIKKDCYKNPKVNKINKQKTRQLKGRK